jgi:NAD(P)-dependent dehydrogenase (short-subunit alcohol dehydrogenase family)
MPATKPVALITGGAKGIGRGIARHLLSCGWQAGIMDLPDSGLRRAFGRARNVLPEGDVRNEDAASAAIAALVRRFGRLDDIVSNAGIMSRTVALKSLRIPPACCVYVAKSARSAAASSLPSSCEGNR